MKTESLALIVLSAGLSGCVSFNETDYPQLSLQRIPEGKDVKVQISGYDALVTSYIPVYGYATVYDADCWGGPRGRWHGGPFVTTVATETYVPQASPTSEFRNRAMETLEKCGAILQSPDPKYRIEMTFGGPIVTDGDYAKILAWNILTILTADYAAQTWTGKLKIYEVATGKLVFSRDYSQRYEVTVWGPIPIFCPGASSKTKCNSIQSWCLTALTDRSVADAVDFLAKRQGDL